MSIKNTPVIADSDTLGTLKLAENLSLFFEDEKLKAQNRIRQCERFINNLNLPSKSVKEGLVSLRQNAEDDYSTLLHLERVLNMRDGGDFIPNLNTQIIPTARIEKELPQKIPEITETSSSGDHIGLSGGGSHLTKNARISIGSSENQFSRYIDDDHGEGRGFEMGFEISDQQSLYSDLDENFDPLQYDAKEIADMKNRQNCDISLTTTNKSSIPSQRKRKDSEEDREPRDEEDEEEDDFIQKESTQRIHIGFHQQRNPCSKQIMARSAPVSIPLSKASIRRKSYDVFSEIESEEENDIENIQGSSKKSKDIIERRQSAIPDKIAQIAKSMYDRDGLGFGESPQKY